MAQEIASTKIRYNRFLQEYCVHAYDVNNKAIPDAMYFTSEKDDAQNTAKAMVNNYRVVDPTPTTENIPTVETPTKAVEPISSLVCRIGQGSKLHPCVSHTAHNGSKIIHPICACPNIQNGRARITWVGQGQRTCRVSS